MNKFLTLIKWLLKAAIFFTLFAFALNNQQDTTVHFFFGNQWRAPQVLVVLSAFALGVAVGVLGMVPWWWRHRRITQTQTQTHSTATSLEVQVPVTAGAQTTPLQPPYVDGI